MKRVADLDVKDPAWREIVVAAAVRNSVKGLPRPAGLPDGGDVTLLRMFGRHRVVYRLPGRTILLGSVKDDCREQIRQEWLEDHPITLKDGRRVVITFDFGNPDLPRPEPAELFRRPTPQGA